MASSATKASWLVAASVMTVEALKNQGGFCRWNYGFRYAKNNMASSLSQAKQANSNSSSSPAAAAASSAAVSKLRRKGTDDEKAKQSEESLRKVMYLSCWWPN